MRLLTPNTSYQAITCYYTSFQFLLPPLRYDERPDTAESFSVPTGAHSYMISYSSV